MDEFVQFALLGLGIGSIYVFGAQALIVIYRGSGILNLGLGATGTAGAYASWDLQYQHHWPFAAAAITGVLFSAAIGALTEALIIRRLRQASAIVRMIATLGVLFTIESIATLRYGSEPTLVKSELPTTVWHLTNGITVGSDRVYLLVIACVLTVVLMLVFGRTRFGLATSAVSESESIAASFGWSPSRVSIVNWSVGSALIGAAAILIAPIVTLQVPLMTTLTLASVAAALVASLRSFPIALAAGIGMGVAETELNRYVSLTGFGSSVPFIVIIVVLVVGGQALPLRDFLLQRMPSVGTGRLRPTYLVFWLALILIAIWTLPGVWVSALIVSIATSLILLSIVVLTGYTGQLSLAQFALAGVGAWFAGRLADAHGWPFLPALAVGILATVPVGIAFALPAVRTRGINLAIVTLGLGTALELMLFSNTNFTGGVYGTSVGSAHVFSLDVGAISHPARFATVCLVIAAIGHVMVANVRRGRTGRRLLAVRTNERAAASMGINVPGAKLYAFGLASALAAAGGILIAYSDENVDYTTFTTDTSILLVGLALIGGIGYLAGPALGSILVTGGLISQILTAMGGFGRYAPLIGGIGIIVLLLQNPDGQVREILHATSKIKARFGRRREAEPTETTFERAVASAPPATPITPVSLTARDVTVRYGGVTAVDRVTIDLVPGRVTGLIGPNGAGKSTLIDAITGFAPIRGGRVELGDTDVTRWSPVRRARAGIARSFQSLELFEDATVLENLQAASEPRDSLSGLLDPIWPRKPLLSAAALSAVLTLGLIDDLDRVVEDLPYGKRRLLAIARAVATQPSVLLLDEPGSGLRESEIAELVTVVRGLATQFGLAVLVVEHDMSFVMPACDDIVVLDFGEMIAHGTPQEVRTNQRVVDAYLGRDEGVVDQQRRTGEVV